MGRTNCTEPQCLYKGVLYFTLVRRGDISSGIRSYMKTYRTIIWPVVLYGCETWSLTLREESRLRVFENRVLRRIFGPKRDEVTGEWRKLHNQELNGMYCGWQGNAVAQCLRRCATNRKVAGTIPEGVIGIFHWHNRTMALGSTQPLTEMSTRIAWG